MGDYFGALSSVILLGAGALAALTGEIARDVAPNDPTALAVSQRATALATDLVNTGLGRGAAGLVRDKLSASIGVLAGDKAARKDGPAARQKIPGDL